MTDSESNDPNLGKVPTVKGAMSSVSERVSKGKRQAPQAGQDGVVESQQLSAVTTPRSSARGWSVFAVLLSMVALLGSGFTWYQNQVTRVERDSRLAVDIGEIGAKVARLGDVVVRAQQDHANALTQADLSAQVQQLKSELDKELDKELDNQIQSLTATQQTLSDSIANIKVSLRKGVNQYVVDEVLQLLRLANNNVFYASDVRAAINALSLADTQLKSLGDPRYTIVRAKINQEIGDLNNVQLLDIEGLSARLRIISNKVPDLPLANEPEQQPTTVSQVPGETELTWRTELKKAWQDILGFVRIHRIDKPPKPLLVPEQRYFLDQNLQLILMKAEIALLQGRASVFKTSLEDAVNWINDYFDLHDARVNSVVEQLRELAAQPVDVPMPLLTGSYELLQNVGVGE